MTVYIICLALVSEALLGAVGEEYSPPIFYLMCPSWLASALIGVVLVLLGVFQHLGYLLALASWSYPT